MCRVCFMFFFKQKTAYELRISDWSSDVCSSDLQVAPLAAVFAGFLVIPILTIIVFSFWDYNFVSIIPDFIFTNYRELLGSEVTLQTYLNTLRYAVMVWALTLAIGFTIAYFLAFHFRSATWQTR